MTSVRQQLQFIKNLPHKTYPAVRQRGALMVGYIRDFQIAEPGVYRASILGTYKYKLEIDCASQTVHCDCPHFVKVAVCKHLVAFAKFLLEQDLPALAWQESRETESPRVAFTDLHLHTFQEIAQKEPSRIRSLQKQSDSDFELVYILKFPQSVADWAIQPVVARKNRQNLIDSPKSLSSMIEMDPRITINATDKILMNPFGKSSALKDFQYVWTLIGPQGRLRNPQNNQPLTLSDASWTPRFRLEREKKDTVLLSAYLISENQQIALNPAEQPVHVFGTQSIYLLTGNCIYPLEDLHWRPESYQMLEKQFLIPNEQLGKTLEVFEDLNQIVELDKELQPKTEYFQPKVIIDIIESQDDCFNIMLGFDLFSFNPLNKRLPGHWGGSYFPYEEVKTFRHKLRQKDRSFKYLEPDQGFVEAQREQFCKCLQDWSEFAKLEEQYPGIREESFSTAILYICPEFFPGTFIELIDLLNKHFEIRGLDLLRKYFLRKGKFEILVTPSGIDWLDLQVDAEFAGEHYGIQEILEKAYVSNGRTVLPLKDGNVGVLPPKLVKILSILRGLQKSSKADNSAGKNSLLVNPWHAGFIEELAEDPNLKIPSRKKVLDQLKTSVVQKAKRVNLPKKLNATLRKYQKEGYQWLNQMHVWKSGGILADDMGLGKTIQVLALLSHQYQNTKEQRPTLIVMPTSLLYNWQKEVEKFVPHLKTLHYYSNDRKDLLTAGTFPYRTLVFTTYTIMQRDIEILEQTELFYAILDESQNIKNPTTQRHKAALRLRAEHRLVMTGTPVENDLLDLWSQFRFINPGFLGGKDFFRRELASGSNGNGNPSESSYNRLARIVEPFYLRRTKGVVLDSLPPKEEHILYVEMDSKQKTVYNKTRDKFRRQIFQAIEQQGIAKSKILVIEGLLRLRQIACAPQLFQPSSKAGAAKLDLIVEKLKEDVIENHKALVFSQFTTLLHLLEKRLQSAGIDYAYLDGTTRNREIAINSFIEKEEKRVFLISLKAGGVGLNLTAADYVFHLDPWWNPAVEAQATDRAHRIGQKNRVIVTKIIAAETVEEKILQLQESKKSLADAVIKSDKSIVRKLTPEMISKLFES